MLVSNCFRFHYTKAYFPLISSFLGDFFNDLIRRSHVGGYDAGKTSIDLQVCFTYLMN